MKFFHYVYNDDNLMLLMAYLEIDDLISTKKKLLERVGKLSEADRVKIKLSRYY